MADGVRGGIAPADYDSNDYDYRTYWQDRGYEQRAEYAALHRLTRRFGRVFWLADFGGGYGRNLIHYRHRALHSVLVDYSANNLRTAESLHDDAVDTGRLHLVRADLRRLPFVDAAFEAALTVRVIHHLPDTLGSLAEMGRTVSRRWLLDLPIKHHALALARAAVRGGWHDLVGPDELVLGTSEHPFHEVNLRVVRAELANAGWSTRLAASVNNFRRWDRVLPKPAVRALAPAVDAAELAAQRGGRGWWGPSQFVLATRRRPSAVVIQPPPGNVQPHTAALATRLVCPDCHVGLEWTDFTADCPDCRSRYHHHDGFWDFAEPTRPTARRAASAARYDRQYRPAHQDTA